MNTSDFCEVAVGFWLLFFLFQIMIHFVPDTV